MSGTERRSGDTTGYGCCYPIINIGGKCRDLAAGASKPCG
jgi:hypothetical protein